LAYGVVVSGTVSVGEMVESGVVVVSGDIVVSGDTVVSGTMVSLGITVSPGSGVVVSVHPANTKLISMIVSNIKTFFIIDYTPFSKN
jgi:hypothetical protein